MSWAGRGAPLAQRVKGFCGWIGPGLSIKERGCGGGLAQGPPMKMRTLGCGTNADRPTLFGNSSCDAETSRAYKRKWLISLFDYFNVTVFAHAQALLDIM